LPTDQGIEKGAGKANQDSGQADLIGNNLQMNINENDSQQGSKKEKVKGKQKRKSDEIIQGQGEQGHAEFHHRVLKRDGFLAGAAFSPQGKIAEDGNIFIPVEIGPAFRAMGGGKDHRLFLVRESEDHNIEE
jgi:hypothetical protein